MKINPWIALSTLLAAPYVASAQMPTENEQEAIASSLKAFSQGIRISKIKVDSLTTSADTTTLWLNSALNDVPMRADNVEAITAEVKKHLPENLKNKPLRIFVAGHELSSLIPRCMPGGRGGKAFTQPAGIPLVRCADRPFEPRQGLQGRHIALWQSHGKYFEAGLHRWEWQRARLFQTVEDKFTQSFVLPYLVPMLEKAGAIVMMPRERDTNPYEVVVDNDGGLADAVGAVHNGKQPWTTGSEKGFAYLRKQYTGFENPFTEGSYQQTTTVRAARDASTITWAPHIIKERNYAVYVSYKTLPNSTTDARYTVYHKDGKTTFLVNQTMGGGTWIYLGTFGFGKGTQGRVVLSNVSAKAGRTVTADAVRFGGGMGNIARCADGDSLTLYTKKYVAQKSRIARNEWQPALHTVPQTSGYPRFEEGARYYMQWAGIPDSIYSPTHGLNDYADDYRDRGLWVNYLAGGTKACPDYQGLNIPIDLSLAFHSDAGTVTGDSIIGTLGIYQTSQYGGHFADGSSRDANRDLCDLVLSSITHDLRLQAEPRWTRRGMWNQRYFEAWVPRVPAMLLELMSHENFADMRYGLDPRFRFLVGRAVYKGILRFLSNEYGYRYVVEPLPVSHFAATFNEHGAVTLSWQAEADSLEPTATADRFIVYKRIGEGDFDNGTLVKRCSYTCEIPSDKVVSFKVTAVNNGGESFDSETLSVGRCSKSATRPVLVINGFDRLSGPDDFRSSDDALAGFLADDDNGVPDREMIHYVGRMKEFRRSVPWTDDDAAGFGDSYGNYERMVIAGNTFDYPALHGRALMKAGLSFVSMSKAAAEGLTEIKSADWSMVDLILGKEKQSKFGRPGLHPLNYKTFDAGMQQLLTSYCQGGGRVFVSGSYVGSDLWCNALAKPLKADQDFAARILKYRWREDRAATTGLINGVPSPLEADSMRLAYYNKPNPESYVVESPDAIVPADSCAYTAFRYTENGMSAGIVFGGNATDHWRTVVLGFPFESVRSESRRNEMMQHIVNYLLK